MRVVLEQEVKWLNNLPLRRKLTLIILLTCSAALILACGVLAAYQRFDFRRTLVRDTTVLADVVGENSGESLQYNDSDTARVILLSLQAEPNVVAAILFRSNGSQIARYLRENSKASVPPKPEKDGQRFANGRLEVFRPVRLKNKRVGTLFLALDMQGSAVQMRLLGGVSAVVLLGSILVALGLAGPLQRSVSRPILALAETARQIAERKDYSARATVPDRHELGALAGAFNNMLAQVQEQNTALAYERDLLTTLLENLPDSIYFKDRASRYVRLSRSKVQKGLAFAVANHRAQNPDAPLPTHLTSLENFSEYLVGKSDDEFFKPEDFRSVREEEETIVNTGKPIFLKVEKAVLRDGKEAWTMSTKMPWRDKDGYIIGTFGTSQDVTTIKETEQRLQSQLQRLNLLDKITRAIGERQDLNSIFQVVIRRLEDQLPIDFGCICLYDAADSMLTVAVVGSRNDSLAQSIKIKERVKIEVDQNGLSRCLRGQLVYEPDLREAKLPFAQRLASAGLCAAVFAPMQVESQIFGVLVAARRAPHSFSSGECEFLKQLSEHVALAAHQTRILTALQQAYDDLRQTQQTVMQQERLRALGQMASGIAHDINNAISPVALYVESLLETEPDLSTRTRDYLGTIQHAIDDVAQTVARMREFYRPREPQLSLMPVKLNQVCQQVLELTRARWNDMAQQRGFVVKVETNLAQDLPPVLGIESEIREAMVNIVFNALDAMPEGGTLTLRTGIIDDVSKTRHAYVEIADTGHGMDEDTRRRCLEPFFTTKGERGTGLGLAMVYGIVRRHNADIEIESAPGKGTTMRMVFAESTSTTSPQTVTPVGPLATRLRILIVDDDPLLIKSLRDTLEMDGHVVIAANGGQEGIETFRNCLQKHETISVVITDLGMPYIDGRQVAAAVKNTSKSTPVILLTGWGLRLIADNDIPPHVDHVLNKPPKLRQLREALAHCISPSPPTPPPS